MYHRWCDFPLRSPSVNKPPIALDNKHIAKLFNAFSPQQGDCYIGKGFEHLDETILGNKTTYFLTRHDTPENVHLCSHAHAQNLCGPTSRYLGSHDSLVFRFLVPVPSQLLDKMDYRPNLYGIEQVMMFNLRTYGNIK